MYGARGAGIAERGHSVMDRIGVRKARRQGIRLHGRIPLPGALP